MSNHCGQAGDDRKYLLHIVIYSLIFVKFSTAVEVPRLFWYNRIKQDQYETGINITGGGKDAILAVIADGGEVYKAEA